MDSLFDRVERLAFLDLEQERVAEGGVSLFLVVGHRHQHLVLLQLSLVRRDLFDSVRLLGSIGQVVNVHVATEDDKNLAGHQLQDPQWAFHFQVAFGLF